MKDPKELEKEKKAREEEAVQLKSDIAAAQKRRDARKGEMDKEADPVLKEDARLDVVFLNREISRMESDLQRVTNAQTNGDSQKPKRRIRSIFG